MKSALSDQVLDWVRKSVGSETEIRSIKRLHGGISSAVHHISLTTGDVVLRQFDNDEWLKEEPDLARHEAESLRLARKAPIPTPEIIAFDETGDRCGMPAVLMTKLEGTVLLKPQHMERWLDGLAESLVRMHSVQADNFPWTYFTYKDVKELEIPDWSSYPELWGAVFDFVREPRPQVKPCFIHRDYHPTNILWVDDKVSGVVDWVNACRGPAGIDIGHCRLNLAMLFGVSTADEFLSAYEKLAGYSFSYHPYWDLLSLIDILFGSPEVYPGWIAFGVTNLTDQMMVDRLDQYMKSLLKKI
ncbi:aminoglycoside phosphotransferase family protein [Bacillus sporothermodurans]|uniref:phosphotransferase family protein n=1 Tax=Heyndrickxia sporothermodurans TaxID=46224 RepID=UPI00192C1C89|nr:aminoglycoside phosphotransferase family protein [Heyndrickxia sporothermodurans]MBL5774276.1 aminoglycoside phosphotransferase family protein [Heyndrickxia sporothermodurans]MBL5787951.1 aminoglycoside phosphotransferase family protein [Heyndrickxia sporothermodurans]MBL5796257.1 aminoglycoside phosphotransferase family protein [Heyndrickxia sporothermodurans]MBL5855898.1 aminoglycoside phosphotransferase family protein [Heyndrickxia sporothermodurans]MBL5868656.1 aminoglycoside phosphotra